MKKILYELYSTKKMACLYSNGADTSKFHFGTVIAINEEEIALQLISPDGDDDGITVIGINNIIRVELDGQYAEKMKKLYAKSLSSIDSPKIENDNITNSILLLAKKERYVVSIELMDSGYNDIVGIVEDIDDIQCKIKQYDEYGYMDGISYCFVNDISKLTFLTQDEKRIMRLIKANG